MIDWYEYWNTRPASCADHDVLRQVGWTVKGQPIGAADVETMVATIRQALQLNAGDSLLDLCCGNGLITSRCAVHCREVTGVDFSVPLIRIARQQFAAANVEYVLSDIRSLPPFVRQREYSKVLMYGAVQHLSPDDVALLLDRLRNSGAGDERVFFGAIPDRDRIWSFYDTEERRLEYARRAQEGTELMGHWWTNAELEDLGQRCGYTVTVLPEHPSLNTAHYRVDALFTPSRARGGR